MSKILIIDTGTSNIKSMANAINHLNFKYEIINTDKKLSNAKCIILPGVGSFDRVMQSIKKKKLDKSLKIAVLENKIPVLGICIGMQILFDKSEEGKEDGLSLLSGKIRKLTYSNHSKHKVPNTGFREVFFSNCNPLVSEKTKKGHLYFNHSYALMSEKLSFNHDKSVHNNEFVASFNYKNIFGMQFHPEKSQKFGLYLIKNFIELSNSILK